MDFQTVTISLTVMKNWMLSESLLLNRLMITAMQRSKEREMEEVCVILDIGGIVLERDFSVLDPVDGLYIGRE